MIHMRKSLVTNAIFKKSTEYGTKEVCWYRRTHAYIMRVLSRDDKKVEQTGSRMSRYDW